MKLAILTGRKKRKTDLKLLKEGRNYFNKVLLVPFSNLSISLDGGFSVMYRKKDLLEYDAIICRLRGGFNPAYTIVKNFPGYSPSKAISFLLTSDRFLMFNHLSNQNIPVPKACMLNSSKPMTNLLSDFKFPISIKVNTKERGIMFADNMDEAKTMIDTLTSLNQLIYVEEHYTKDLIEAYVIGSEVVASVRRKSKNREDMLYGRGKMKRVKLSKDLEDLAVSAADAVQTEFARVDLMENPQRVIGMELTPYMTRATEKTGKNIHSALVSYVEQSAGIREKAGFSMLARFVEFLKGRLGKIE